MPSDRRQARERAAKKIQDAQPKAARETPRKEKSSATRRLDKSSATRRLDKSGDSSCLGKSGAPLSLGNPGGKPLNAKQSRFVEEYLIDLNATQSAIRAGYSAKTAHSQGPRLLEHVGVAAAIEKASEACSERTQVTQDQVINELKKLAFSNMEDFSKVGEDGDATLNLKNIDRDQFAAVTELTTDSIGGVTTRNKIKLSCKRASLELLGKHLGMFNKLVIAGDPDSPIVTQVTRRIVDAPET